MEIYKSNTEWKYIVCANKARVRNIESMARRMNLDIPFPITIEELPLKQGSFIKSVLVDDIEDILSYLLGKEVDYVTTRCDIERLP